ncbi:response regulator [Spirosoma sp. KUDC1026]|uniref:response regulator n=1 Tax=Spirosoma sp. KUDC1026 TaxID=2745947 RepID=UPI00159BB777|nr:response regulator [Spirosoma sp. KUDC1026]QKZ15113.1 response regulator [Spirosoma sp. KUDC1026]
MKPQTTDYVFLVDDDEDDCFLTQLALEREAPQYKFKTIGNGMALIDALNQASVLPRLVLLDLNMPIMNGLEALERIRQNERYADLPVVILTTSDQESDKQQAAKLQADGFITKPFTSEQYQQAIAPVVKQWL